MHIHLPSVHPRWLPMMIRVFGCYEPIGDAIACAARESEARAGETPKEKYDRLANEGLLRQVITIEKEEATRRWPEANPIFSGEIGHYHGMSYANPKPDFRYEEIGNAVDAWILKQQRTACWNTLRDATPLWNMQGSRIPLSKINFDPVDYATVVINTETSKGGFTTEGLNRVIDDSLFKQAMALPSEHRCTICHGTIRDGRCPCIIG